MSWPAIQVNGLSKQYQLGERQAGGYRSLRDVVSRSLNGLLRRGDEAKETAKFWALRDVSFNVEYGEVLGIIGRNGAGKSTLLKVLTRITEPTQGEVRLRGRVGSLLEVGTGFHPELTGRENIFLNGAILGMRRREIARKFDEIVDFAEVEKFIDTPVKRYSSGMYLRLAFSVAAHLETEILLVDEVLAVGDAAFQKKCLGKMGDVAKTGRTVLFVSHNMMAMNALCENGLMLSSGQIVMYAPIQDTIAYYLQQGEAQARLNADLRQVQHKGNGKGVIESIRLTTGWGEDRFPYPGDDIELRLQVRSHQPINGAALCLVIYDLMGNRIIDVNNNILGLDFSMPAGETRECVFKLYNVLLHPGRYRIMTFLGVQNIEIIDHVEEALIFEVYHNPHSVKETLDYPGVYRCKFDLHEQRVLSQV